MLVPAQEDDRVQCLGGPDDLGPGELDLLDHPYPGPVGTPNKAAYGIPRGRRPAGRGGHHPRLDRLIAVYLSEVRYGQVAIETGLAEPADDALCRREYPGHQRKLACLLFLVGLVDAYCICPQEPRLFLRPQVSEGREKITPNFGELPVEINRQFYCLVSPHIRQGIKDRGGVEICNSDGKSQGIVLAWFDLQQPDFWRVLPERVPRKLINQWFGSRKMRLGLLTSSIEGDVPLGLQRFLNVFVAE